MSNQSLQEMCVCMGQPVAGNPTQYMMEKAFAKAGLDWRYQTFEVSAESLGDAMRGFRVFGFRGGNFTIPHKVAVIEYLDELSEAARLMGAVNCVNRLGDRLIGENTDGKGFLQSLREICDPQGKRVVILGAGGAARAIAVELALAGIADVVILNRDEGRGQQLATLLAEQIKVSARWEPWLGDQFVPECDVLINATSVGLNDPKGRVPIAVSSIRPEMIVADVVFNPPQTRFLAEAAERGCKTLDGLGMLVNQAVISFKIWTGVDPDPAVMREALEEFLGI